MTKLKSLPLSHRKNTEEQPAERPAGAEASAPAPKSQPPPLAGTKGSCIRLTSSRKPRPKPSEQPQPSVLGNPYHT